ncbi:MAG: hypothetical protein CMK83_16360 [Pseudomonadales bacterium]|nr:hypothetical protein [Pseudomonadales bacterium]MBI28120.1 hypothetical protein [Pseudomonadales bacterium]HAG95096.1 hypothetical protein [Gammaproteobacteria bacterium]|tara:strand:+ start:534 stop:1382 length:849 start_codon:yes stop_codon:yes gene_type:complete
MDILGRRAIVLSFLLTSLAAMAASGQTIFQSSEVVSEQRDESRHYILPLGRIKLDRSLGRDMPATYKRMDGEFSSTVWELTGGENIQEARDQVQSVLESAQYELLFSCFSRDCGESFAWANAKFNEPMLYGNDRTQSLWVVKDRGARRYHVYYLVERPNRRRYFYRETLFVPELKLDAQVIASMLEEQGYLILGELVIKEGMPDFSLVVEKVTRHAGDVKPELLVIHRHGEAQALAPVAEVLQAQLKAKGLDVPVLDAANLAPRPDAPGRVWVEWVAPDWEP